MALGKWLAVLAGGVATLAAVLFGVLFWFLRHPADDAPGPAQDSSPPEQDSFD